MSSFWLSSLFIQVLDEQNQPILLPCQKAFDLQTNLMVAQEKALNIHRTQAQFIFINLPDQPESLPFQCLTNAIRNVATFKDIAPETNTQAVWMRCVQLYWQAKAIALANKIYKLIPDPAQPSGPLTKMLPARALANLKLDVEADFAWYNLLKAGEPVIKAWAERQKIPYPFSNCEQLFIETLKVGFEINLTEEAFTPLPLGWSRKQERDHYRGWLKFFGDHFDGEPKEKEYEAVLRSMGWKGYAFQALRGKKREKPLGKLWQAYLNAQRPLCQFLDSRLEWKDGIPYQSATINGKRTKTRKPIQGIITDEGFLDWQWC